MPLGWVMGGRLQMDLLVSFALLEFDPDNAWISGDSLRRGVVGQPLRFELAVGEVWPRS